MKYLVPILFLALGGLIGYNVKKCAEFKKCDSVVDDKIYFKGIISIQSDAVNRMGLIRFNKYTNGQKTETSIGIPYFDNGNYKNGDEVAFYIHKNKDFTFAQIIDNSKTSGIKLMNHSNNDNLINLHNIQPHGNHAHKRFHWRENKGMNITYQNKQYNLVRGVDNRDTLQKIFLAIPTSLYNSEIENKDGVYYHVESYLPYSNKKFEIVTSWGSSESEAHAYN